MPKIGALSNPPLSRKVNSGAVAKSGCHKPLKNSLLIPRYPRRYQPVSIGACGRGSGRSAAKTAVLTNAIAPASEEILTALMASSFRPSGAFAPEGEPDAYDRSKRLNGA